MNDEPSTGHDIVVVGASAGGVEALSAFVGGLPADLEAAVFVVLHVPVTPPSALPSILARAGPLPVAHARDGDDIELGRIYVAPPDHHLLVKKEGLRVVRGPRENNHRPAIDPLFRSAALAFGSRVVGIVLSGTLDDGAAGVQVIRRRGGDVIVQDPREAVYPEMPRNAILADEPNVLPLEAIARRVAELAGRDAGEEAPISDQDRFEADIAELDVEAIEAGSGRPGTVSPFSCPECGGTLWQLPDDDLMRFRCRVGHAYASETLFEAQERTLDGVLWTALRALEERASLATRIAARIERGADGSRGERYRQRAAEAEADARAIRFVLLARSGSEVEEKTG